jgi:hypothetical protein
MKSGFLPRGRLLGMEQRVTGIFGCVLEGDRGQYQDRKAENSWVLVIGLARGLTSVGGWITVLAEDTIGTPDRGALYFE